MSCNWHGVLQFLHNQHHQAMVKENQWMLTKKELQQKIAELESRLKACQQGNQILLKRNKMLQTSLKLQLKSNTEAKPFVDQPQITLPRRKPKSNRQIFQKVILSLGLKDVMGDGGLIPHNITTQIKSLSKAKQKYSKVATLKGHTQSIKAITYVQKNNSLVSVSDDRQLKIWALDKLNEGGSQTTLRQSIGSIISLASCNSNDQFSNLVFASGIEGTIKAIQVSENTRKMVVGSFSTGELSQTIWQLLYCRDRRHLLAASASGLISCLQVDAKLVQSQLLEVTGRQICGYALKEKSDEEADIPSAMVVPQTKSQVLVAAFMHSNSLVIFDRQTQKIISKAQIKADWSSGVNCMKSWQGMIASAHQDKCVRLFDLNSLKFVSCFHAHEEAVTSLAVNNKKLVTGSRDGTVKVWAPGMEKSVEEDSWVAHSRRYGESVTGLQSWKNSVASCGVDAVINIYRR